MQEFVVKNPKQTQKVARHFVKSLVGGEKILLNGDLGAGKTTFTKFVAKALGVKESVTSPSFTIMKQYKGKFNIYHFDLYRLEEKSELQELGFEEYIDNDLKDSIVLIEWGERADLSGDKFITINIEKKEGNNRIIRIKQ